MRIQIHNEGKLIVDATLPNNKENFKILKELINLNIDKQQLTNSEEIEK